MDNLFVYYGDRQQLDQSAMKIYRDICAKVPDNKKDDLYRKVVINYKFFPKIPEIEECISAISLAKGQSVTNSERCWICMDRGFVDYTKKGIPPFTDYPYGFSARCCCEMGKVWTVFPAISNIFPQQAIDEMIANNKKIFTPNSEELQRAKSSATTIMEAMKL